MRKKRFKFPFRATSLIALFLLAILTLVYLFRSLKASDYFKIKDVEFSGCPDDMVRQDKGDYTGERILEFSLGKASKRLTTLYPEYKYIIVRRMLPDKIIINFKPRHAVARVKLPESFCVDEEGFLFHIAQNDDSQLPLIVGLETRISNPHSGVKYNDSSLLKTLRFVENLNKNRILSKELKIKNINLANINDIFVLTDTGCQINLGDIDSLNEKLPILQKLIGTIGRELSRVKYIDLRFKEPLVKYYSQ